jgi:hypothetical protein
VEQSFINDYSAQAFYKVFSFGVFLEFNENFGLGEIKVYIMCLLILSGKWWGEGSKI